MILGNGDLSFFDASLIVPASILVIICTLFAMILMLNLLIAIINEIYTKVQENQIDEFYQEKASIIYENYYLITADVKKEQINNKQPNHMLLIGKKKGNTDFGSNVEEEDLQRLDKQQQNLLNQIKEFIDEKYKAAEKEKENSKMEDPSFIRKVTQK